MADIKSQAVKLMAEEIIRAINKITDDNNRGYVNNQIANHGGSGSGGGGGGGGVYPGTIPASQVSGLTTAIANYIYSAPEMADDGDVDAGRVIATLNGLSALVVQSATIDTAQIENLYSSYGEFINLVAEKAELEEVDTEELYAQFAEMGLANIGTANIGFGQIKDLVSDTAIIRQGTGGKLYIDRLSVTDANMVSLTTGELMLKNTDGQFVRIVVNPTTGAVSSEVVTFDGDDVFNNASLSGTKMIENTITARELNVTNIFADSALVSAIKAVNIDVNDLFANTTFTNKITSPAVGSNIDISSNASILLTQGRIDLLIDGTSSSTQLVITDGLIRAIGNKFSVIADTIDLSNNTTIARQVKVQNTSPTSPSVNDLWLDISLNPPVLKQYTSNGWVVVNDTSGLEDEFTEIVENLEFRIDSQDGSISTLAERVTTVESTAHDLSTRVQTAESKITPAAIVQTVRSSTDYQTDLSTLEMTSSKFETFVASSSSISQIGQTASKINLVVTNASSQGNIYFTEGMSSAIESEVNLMALDSTSELSTQFTLTPAKLESIIQSSGSSTTIKQTIGKINATVSSVDGQGNVTLTDKALSAIADNIDLQANESVSIIVGNSTQTAKNYADDKIDDLKIGSRNYIPNGKSLLNAVMISTNSVYQISNQLHIISGVQVTKSNNTLVIV